ncbi:MAG: hypothetical protein ACRC6E_11410, partial [Fusobacteriaceae bacterium]
KKLRATVLAEENKFEFWKIMSSEENNEVFLVGAFRTEKVIIIDVGTTKEYDYIQYDNTLQETYNFFEDLENNVFDLVVEDFTSLGDKYEL